MQIRFMINPLQRRFTRCARGVVARSRVRRGAAQSLRQRIPHRSSFIASVWQRGQLHRVYLNSAMPSIYQGFNWVPIQLRPVLEACGYHGGRYVSEFCYDGLLCYRILEVTDRSGDRLRGLHYISWAYASRARSPMTAEDWRAEAEILAAVEFVPESAGGMAWGATSRWGEFENFLRWRVPLGQEQEFDDATRLVADFLAYRGSKI